MNTLLTHQPNEGTYLPRNEEGAMLNLVCVHRGTLETRFNGRGREKIRREKGDAPTMHTCPHHHPANEQRWNGTLMRSKLHP